MHDCCGKCHFLPTEEDKPNENKVHNICCVDELLFVGLLVQVFNKILYTCVTIITWS
jgi:hypothetical protein